MILQNGGHAGSQHGVVIDNQNANLRFTHRTDSCARGEKTKLVGPIGA
ncbi:hypothetical protein [Lysobacter gummosus]